MKTESSFHNCASCGSCALLTFACGKSKPKLNVQQIIKPRNNNLGNISFFSFYLNIYVPDSQESDGGALHRANNYPVLLLEIQSIVVRLKF